MSPTKYLIGLVLNRMNGETRDSISSKITGNGCARVPNGSEFKRKDAPGDTRPTTTPINTTQNGPKTHTGPTTSFGRATGLFRTTLSGDSILKISGVRDTHLPTKTTNKDTKGREESKKTFTRKLFK